MFFLFLIIDTFSYIVIIRILIKDLHFMILVLFIPSGVTFAYFFTLIFSNFNNLTVPYHAKCPLFGHD